MHPYWLFGWEVRGRFVGSMNRLKMKTTQYFHAWFNMFFIENIKDVSNQLIKTELADIFFMNTSWIEFTNFVYCLHSVAQYYFLGRAGRKSKFWKAKLKMIFDLRKKVWDRNWSSRSALFLELLGERLIIAWLFWNEAGMIPKIPY